MREIAHALVASPRTNFATGLVPALVPSNHLDSGEPLLPHWYMADQGLCVLCTLPGQEQLGLQQSSIVVVP